MSPALRVAIVGSSPEGLEAAKSLRDFGCQVTQILNKATANMDSSTTIERLVVDSVQVQAQVDGSLLLVSSCQDSRTRGTCADYLLLPPVQFAQLRVGGDAELQKQQQQQQEQLEQLEELPAVELPAVMPTAAMERVLPLGSASRTRLEDLLKQAAGNQPHPTESQEEKLVKHYTLIFVRSKRSQQVLLGLKKRGFGAGKWDGFGGKVEPGESVVAGAARELEEESGLRVEARHLRYVGLLEFEYLSLPKLLQVHSFEVSVEEAFGGADDALPEAVESEEMRPEWFAESDFPFDDMWQDSRWWVPPYLEGKYLPFRGSFRFLHHEGEESKVLLGFSLSSEQCSERP